VEMRELMVAVVVIEMEAEKRDELVVKKVGEDGDCEDFSDDTDEIEGIGREVKEWEVVVVEKLMVNGD